MASIIKLAGSPSKISTPILNISLLNAIAGVPGKRHCLLADALRVKNSGVAPEINAYDLWSQHRVVGPLTRCPDVVTPGSGWNGRKVIEGAGVTNNLLTIQNVQFTGDISFAFVANINSAKGGTLLSSPDENFKIFQNASNYIFIQTNKSGGNRSFALTAGVRAVIATFNGTTGHTSFYVDNDPDGGTFDPADGALPLPTVTSPADCYIMNAGAKEPFSDKLGFALILGVDLAKTEYNDHRNALMGAMISYYGL